jgi:hypothetical protein
MVLHNRDLQTSEEPVYQTLNLHFVSDEKRFMTFTHGVNVAKVFVPHEEAK